MKTAPRRGQGRQGPSGLARRAVVEGQSVAQVAWVVRGPAQTGATWLRACCGDGLPGAPRPTPTGRPPQLPPPPQAARATLLDAGPGQAGWRGACWRAPRIPPRMGDRCGVSAPVCSVAPLLQTGGGSAQPAAGVSDHRHAQQRQEGRTTPGPQRRRRAPARQARRRGGEAAAGPPGGPLTSPWARRGPPPTVTPSGKRTGSKVCGVRADCTGRLVAHGREGRLPSGTSRALLQRVLADPLPPLRLLQEGAREQTRAETRAGGAQQAARLQVVPVPTSAPDDHPREQRW